MRLRRRGAEGSCRDTAQASVGFMIGQNRQTKNASRIFAAPLDFTKFSRRAQSLPNVNLLVKMGIVSRPEAR
jgi:hypothetical protein